MPHVHVYLYPGRSQEQQQRVTERIVAAISEEMGVAPEWISVVFEEVTPERWEKAVVHPYLRAGRGVLIHRPGYLTEQTEEE
ncbi:MAG: hypothetical protein KatS3mg115_0179 [Candidatus Poribacteria bacterium]|nr:MAG: hypothetical protein KatS3mg115_0179 [Candidatus Poribacteria bacterium]